MKRLVYSPSINAWVKTDTGIFDLSPYITSFSIDRKVNSVSSASLTFRNPKVKGDDGTSRFIFTQHPTVETNGTTSYRPMFHPMDPIVITLTRLKGHPVQLFTGYCDKTPYVQLFPGTAQLTASCTLKRLMYTYWDPGLEHVNHFLATMGWSNGSQIINPDAEGTQSNNLNDSSIGYMLYRVLQDVGGWKHDDIFIQELPNQQIGKAVKSIYQDLTGDAKASFKTFSDFLDKVVGVGHLGGAGSSNGTSGTTGNSSAQTWPPGEGREIGASVFTDVGGDAGGPFGCAGQSTPDGVIPGGDPPPRDDPAMHGLWFAEASTGGGATNGLPNDWSALGDLPCGTPMQVTYNGKSIIARKADNGAGGARAPDGRLCDMDLWITSANALGIPGTAVVKAKRLTEADVKRIRRGE